MNTTIIQPQTKTLADLIGTAGSSGARLRVLIVTPDLLGPVKNGGIGTACTYLAYALADYGHKVCVLFSQSNASESNASWRQDYTEKGINVIVASEWDTARGRVPCFPDHAPLYMAHVVHDWLTAQTDFDLILFMEWGGHGFYALHAKQCGLHFQNTVMAVVVHSPSLWHGINNAAAQIPPLESCTWHMERSCIEMADAVISPSVYMLDWCREHGYRLPQHAFVQPNLLEWDEKFRHTSNKMIDELVFFGRLEYRKGLEQFCAALDILEKQKQLPKCVTFLGKCAWMGEEHSVLYIARRAKEWKSCAVSLKLHYNHVQAVHYLCGKGRMAVMPSVADNSPYSVYESLVAGIPFVARDVGGIAELTAKKDRESILCSDNPRDLASKLSVMLGKPPRRAALSFDRAANVKAWCEGLTSLVDLCRKQNTIPLEMPFISVCLTHYNRPHLLWQAVDSLLAQDYPHFEVILADDGSTDVKALKALDALEPVFRERGWKILRLQNGYLGKARNAAAKESKGSHLLFMDDDNVAKPNMLRSFAKAAESSRADLVVSAFDVFFGDGTPTKKTLITERYLPLGGAVAYTAIANVIGDSNSLIRRETFEKLGGFTENYGLGHEDFELYLRVVLNKGRVSIIPDATFWYRRNDASMLSSTNIAANRMRSLRPFMELWPAPLAELALMTHGMANILIPTATKHLAPGNASEISYLDTKGDPHSDEVLAQAATVLTHNGQSDIADAVLASLYDAAAGASTQTTLLGMRAKQAASEGNLRALQASMEVFEATFPRLPDASNTHERCIFYVTVLQSLPLSATMHAARATVVDCLTHENNTGMDINLVLARHNALMGKIDAAVHAFLKALIAAETVYLESREDVSNAVLAGDFICALQHYSLHGTIDKTQWPKKHLFSHALKSHPKLFSSVCDAYMNRYTITSIADSQKILASLQENI